MIALAAAPSVPLAFLAGLVSFLSPCVFPLIPAYAAYLGGRAGQPAMATADGPSLEANGVRVPVIANGIAFVAGFSLVGFLAVYAAVYAAGAVALTIAAVYGPIRAAAVEPGPPMSA